MARLNRLDSAEPSFSALFELMFSDRDNVMYEKSVGYRIDVTTCGQARSAALSAVPALRRAVGDCPRQSVVGLHMQNCPQWIELFWAILAAGYRPLLMNTRLDTASLEEALSRCGAAAVISDGRVFSVRTIQYQTLLTGSDAPEEPEPDSAVPDGGAAV